MLEDLVIQFFSAKPRREIAVYLLLVGKKTLSNLYAALEHAQLQWLQLYPTLAREDFQAAVERLVRAGALTRTETGLILNQPEAKQRAAARLPLPAHYAAQLDVQGFEQRLLLGVQVVSEARYHARAYRPVSSDWATQQAIRRWSRAVALPTVISELTAAFAALPDATANRLAARFVGHDYVGDAPTDGLRDQLGDVDALSQLILVIAAHPEWLTLHQLWGGPKSLLSASNRQACALATAGASRETIATQLRLRPSTVNEHLLGATILGWQPPITALIPVAVMGALTALPRPLDPDYHHLLAAVPEADFFAVRLAQILDLQGRWPNE
ncbi:hypothetical protein [Lacticaseibacillus absianus]|uniref:hypothetical protein n=1 Tax=Lacticaseibacillus absianus TaxID=2729623 RepID=UPI0015CDA8C8|nr:hypothetical protein [Lacticaseibacillus absianus]